jgi:hypothetical protein
MRSLLSFVEPNLDRLDNETCAVLAVVGAVAFLALVILSPRIK